MDDILIKDGKKGQNWRKLNA